MNHGSMHIKMNVILCELRTIQIPDVAIDPRQSSASPASPPTFTVGILRYSTGVHVCICGCEQAHELMSVFHGYLTLEFIILYIRLIYLLHQ